MLVMLSVAFVCVLISAPSLRVYYFLLLTLSVCLSVTNIDSSFLFLDGIEPCLDKNCKMLLLDFRFVAMATKFGLFFPKNRNCFFFVSRWNQAMFWLLVLHDPSTKRCSSVFELGPLTPKIYSPTLAQNRL